MTNHTKIISDFITILIKTVIVTADVETLSEI
jgi:hypothetical protein